MSQVGQVSPSDSPNFGAGVCVVPELGEEGEGQHPEEEGDGGHGEQRDQLGVRGYRN